MSLVITNIKGMGYRYKKSKVNIPFPILFVVGCSALHHQTFFTMLFFSTLQDHTFLLQYVSLLSPTYWASCTVCAVVFATETVVCVAKPPV